MTYLKHTHLSTLSIASALLLSACGGGGSSSGGTTTPPDTTPPTIFFSPSTLTVASEQTGAASTSTSGGLASTLAVSCTNGGSYSFDTDLFTAAAVTTNTTSVCTATISDAAGNEGAATLTVTMTPPPPPDTEAPVLSFTPATVTVQSGSTVSSVLSATDNTDVTTGPVVTCTEGGSFNVSTNVFTPAVVSTNTDSVCTATASDAAGNEGTATLTATMTPPPASVDVTISGKLTYDRVPFNPVTSALNYGDTTQLPIRQAPVELLNAAGTVLESTVSDDNGDYSFTVESGQDVRVRVRSEIQKGAPNEIDLKVVDNTSSDALYAMQGTLSAVPTSNQTRDLNAASGWGTTSYTSTRTAAPFALLDTIYETMEDFIAVDSEVDFPAVNVLWSTRNRAESGVVANGQIGTSSFTVSNGIPVLRILGDDGNDTDEYDVHVVVHEFGHYFENSLSRADSIGGAHSSSDRLDARVAFGEGWGNALSGMILDDPIYRDSFGSAQGSGFEIDVENNTYASTGWYSEGSVQSILYDLYDSDDDGADSATFGLAPIYGAFTDPDYKETEAFTTIFAFLEALENQSGVTASEVTALTTAQSISGSGGFGIGETNSGGISDALPVYLPLSTDGTTVEFCSVDNFGEYNKHGNRRYFEFNIATSGSYRFTMARESGAATSDPDFVVFKDGLIAGVGESAASNTETADISLNAGQHVMEAYNYNNLGQGTASADVCYTMKLEAQ